MPFEQQESLDVESSVNRIRCYLLSLQDEICAFAEAEDGSVSFKEDLWQHKTGGGGRTRVLAEGKVIEKAGVNFSHVQGSALPKAALARAPHLADAPFQALGVSVVMHPRNPYAPTSHLNVRFLVVEQAQAYWWFGGGFDMTPYFGFIDDCVHWHSMANAACEAYGDDVYQQYKEWADRYFYLPHRDEPRGIGGIFYDDLNVWGFEKCFSFMQSVGSYYLKAYQPILNKRKTTDYGEAERHFQLVRRGRYVEFNLLYDRGTLFGLQSGGRTESILMSLPPFVRWEYDYHPSSAKEKELLAFFLQNKNWLAMRQKYE